MDGWAFGSDESTGGCSSSSSPGALCSFVLGIVGVSIEINLTFHSRSYRMHILDSPKLRILVVGRGRGWSIYAYLHTSVPLHSPLKFHEAYLPLLNVARRVWKQICR
jgi:hypothetical protein